MNMIVSHYEEKEVLIQQLDSDENNGLTLSQVEKNREKYGRNTLK